MTLQCINPDNLPTPSSYSQVVVATGSKLVFIAGQEPEDEQGNLVLPGDLAGQARQVFTNLGHALDAAGARQLIEVDASAVTDDDSPAPRS